MVRCLVGSVNLSNIVPSMLNVDQEALLSGKLVAEGFVGGSRVNQHGLCSIQNTICVRGGVGLGTDIGILSGV